MERKFEEEFAEYCRIKYDATYNIRKVLKLCIGQTIVRWDNLPFEMQWGILVDFFEENGIIMDIQPVMSYNESCYTKVKSYIPNVVMLKSEEENDLPEQNSRQETRKVALEKAKQLFNNQSK